MSEPEKPVTIITEAALRRLREKGHIIAIYPILGIVVVDGSKRYRLLK